MAVELRNALSQSLGCSLPATLAFDYPTVATLADASGRQAFRCGHRCFDHGGRGSRGGKRASSQRRKCGACERRCDSQPFRGRGGSGTARRAEVCLGRGAARERRPDGRAEPDQARAARGSASCVRAYAQVEAARHELIAIVGMGLRFPGAARDAESFGRLLWSGTDAVTDIPAERWSLDALYAEDPDAPGKMMTRYGAFLEKSIASMRSSSASRRARPRPWIRSSGSCSKSPGKRWRMRVALAHRSRARARASTRCVNNDYGRALCAHQRADRCLFQYRQCVQRRCPVASPTSWACTVRASRCGHGLLVVTGGSASRLPGAARARMRHGAGGGVNLILTPEMNINFSKARMMAPDGRCKTFDAAADGYVRGEGVGLVVLQPAFGRLPTGTVCSLSCADPRSIRTGAAVASRRRTGPLRKR